MIELRPAAVDDILAARDYYEDKQPGLGEEFVDELDRIFARLELFPLGSPMVAGYEGVRRARLRRFPFGVFYIPDESDRIDVLRVIHTARSPRAWADEADEV